MSNFYKTDPIFSSIPEMIDLMGFKQLSWTNTDFLFDGNGTTKGAVRQTGTTPDIGQIVGFTAGPISSDLAVGAFGHVRSLFNHTTVFDGTSVHLWYQILEDVSNRFSDLSIASLSCRCPSLHFSDSYSTGEGPC